MEYGPFTEHLVKYLPAHLTEEPYFVQYMLGQLPDQKSQTD
jgi:hypothetical protein